MPDAYFQIGNMSISDAFVRVRVVKQDQMDPAVFLLIPSATLASSDRSSTVRVVLFTNKYSVTSVAWYTNKPKTYISVSVAQLFTKKLLMLSLLICVNQKLTLRSV